VRPLSYTSFSTYRKCPFKYKLRYVDGVPEGPRHYYSFGSTLHRSVEFFYKHFEAPELDELLGYYDKHWVSAGYGSKEQEMEYKALGTHILTLFHELNSDNYLIPLALERSFKMEVEGIPVRGIIDRVDRVGSKLRIIDYKSAKRMPSSRDVSENQQLTMYQLAVERDFGHEVEKVGIYHLRRLKTIWSPARTLEEKNQFIGQLMEVAEGIESCHFPAVKGYYCQHCDYQLRCPHFRL